MTNARLSLIDAQLAEQAGQQAAIERKSPTIIAYPIRSTREDIVRLWKVLRQHCVTEERATFAARLLVEYLRQTGQLS